MASIKVDGLENLQKRLKENVQLTDVKRVVRTNGAELQKKMQENADFTRGYATGTTKRSIGLEIRDDGFTADVGAETEYAPYLEYGTRFMDAQPFVKPSLDAQKAKFKRDLQNLVR